MTGSKKQTRNTQARKKQTGKSHTRKRQTARRRSSDPPDVDRIRLALLGCGEAALPHLDSLPDIHPLQLVGLYDQDRKQADRLAKTVQQRLQMTPAVYQNLQQLMQVEQPDAVWVNLPAGQRPEAIQTALQAGAHVFSELPVAGDLDTVDRLCRTAAAADRLITGHCPALLTPEVSYVRSIFQREELGDVPMIAGGLTLPLAGPVKGKGKSALPGWADLFSHAGELLAAILFITDQPLREVRAEMPGIIKNGSLYLGISLVLEPGMLVRLSLAAHPQAPSSSLICFHGEKGRIRTGLHAEQCLEHLDAQGRYIRYPYVPYAPVTALGHFTDVLQGNDRSRLSGPLLLRMAETIQAVHDSLTMQQTISVRHRQMTEKV